MDRCIVWRRSAYLLPAAMIRFYSVGFVLFAVPVTRGLFISLTTPALLLALGAVLWCHRDWNVRTIAWFAFIAVSAFALERAGVQTGIPFGSYRYGRGLAPLVGGTPLIIGCNWLLLVYCSRAIAMKLFRRPWTQIVGGGLLMVAYDVLAEWVAPVMQMWWFDGGYAPLRNFAVWFAAALLYHAGCAFFGIRVDNRPARFLFGVQCMFFLLIGLYATIFIS